MGPCRERYGRWLAHDRTGQLRAGQPKRDNHGSIKHDITAETEHPRQDSRERSVWTGWPDKSSWTGWLINMTGQDSWDRTMRQDKSGMTAITGQP